MPTVSNPFLTTPNQRGVGEPANPSAYIQERGTPRWSRRQEESNNFSTLESNEAAVAAEEAMLKAKLLELEADRRRQEEEQLLLSAGWASLFEREERYYTEPALDLSADIAAREQHCHGLHAQLEQMEAHLFQLTQEAEIYQPLLQERDAVAEEIQTVKEGFEKLKQKRQGLIARAERYFDVETKRSIEGKRAIHRLDVVLKEMTQSGALAQLQASRENSRNPSRSASRCVTFAPMKSIVLDANSGASSVEPDEMGMTNSYGENPINDHSVCIGLEDAEELGGNSVMYSLNNSHDQEGIKRRRFEPVSIQLKKNKAKSNLLYRLFFFLPLFI
ncbi:hypothetical protein AGDE_01556 [Angomonas deanei]|nr:hypothetical protein AGDE_01556 [Angomonas deanei]|eukprot:EPY42367.1 hypothetical protein AGDE_01556 [Angomonas deanei]